MIANILLMAFCVLSTIVLLPVAALLDIRDNMHG